MLCVLIRGDSNEYSKHMWGDEILMSTHNICEAILMSGRGDSNEYPQHMWGDSNERTRRF